MKRILKSQHISLVETAEKQNKIIKMQSDIISKLYSQLSQYATIEEIERSGIVEQISEVVELKT